MNIQGTMCESITQPSPKRRFVASTGTTRSVRASCCLVRTHSVMFREERRPLGVASNQHRRGDPVSVKTHGSSNRERSWPVLSAHTNKGQAPKSPHPTCFVQGQTGQMHEKRNSNTPEKATPSLQLACRDALACAGAEGSEASVPRIFAQPRTTTMTAIPKVTMPKGVPADVMLSSASPAAQSTVPRGYWAVLRTRQ